MAIVILNLIQDRNVVLNSDYGFLHDIYENMFQVEHIE